MVNLSELTQADIDYANTELRADIERTRRNQLLDETDWWAVSDRTMSQSEIDYRQALRDITEQEGFPQNVVWPTKPEV